METVNHPAHYNAHPSGVECIDIVETMGFNIGNAVKYLWRAGLKNPEVFEASAKERHDKHIDDLKKAVWYIEREIARRASVESEGLGVTVTCYGEME